MPRRIRLLLLCWLLSHGLLAGAGATASEPDSALPDEVDLRPLIDERHGPPQNQGRRNTCSLFAITTLAGVAAAADAETQGPQRLSVEFLTWAANSATGRRGDQAMFYEALHGLNAVGLCADEAMPYADAEDPRRRPSEDALIEAVRLQSRWTPHWIKRWDVATPLTDDQFQTILRALAEQRPVACGLRWPHGLRGSDLLDVPPPEGVFDGHSIVLTGYQRDPDQPGGGVFRFRNSSGSSWGDGGYGRMSFDYVRAYANDALWLELEPSGLRVTTFEAERLEIAASSEATASVQAMRPFGGRMWSGREQLLVQAVEGATLELRLPIAESGRYRVRLLATTGPDYGVIEAELAGSAAQGTFDLYSGRVSPTGPVELGEVHLEAGEHTLRIRAAGKHPASSGTSFGLDAVELIAHPRDA